MSTRLDSIFVHHDPSNCALPGCLLLILVTALCAFVVMLPFVSLVLNTCNQVLPEACTHSIYVDDLSGVVLVTINNV